MQKNDTLPGVVFWYTVSMIFAETSAHKTPYADEYTFVGPGAAYDLDRVLLAAENLVEMDQLAGDAYTNLHAWVMRYGAELGGDTAIADILHKTLQGFPEGIERYCQQAGLSTRDYDMLAPNIIGRDGLLRVVEETGLVVLCDGAEAVLGGDVHIAKAMGATTVAFQYDLDFNIFGDPYEGDLREHLSLGVMQQQEYRPIATMFNRAHPRPRRLQEQRFSGVLATANVVNVAPRQYSPDSL